MAPVKTTLLACVAVLLMPALAPAQEVFKEITSERLEELLRTMKIDYKKDDAGKGTTFYDYKSKGFDLRLTSFGGNDLMIDCIWNAAAPLAKLNQWNLKRYHVRAVLYDNNGKPYVALESNLDCLGGVSESIIRHFITMFWDKDVRDF